MPTATPRPTEESEPTLLVDTAKTEDIQTERTYIFVKVILVATKKYNQKSILLNKIYAFIRYVYPVCLLNLYGGSYRCRLPCSFVPEAVSAMKQ